MKKIVSALLALCMAVSLCACATTVAPTYEGSTEELNVILDMIAEIPVATMGVSMTITTRAVEYLNWCEATSMTQDELAQYVKQYFDALDADVRPMYSEQVMEWLAGVETLSKDDRRAGALSSAGFSTKLTWSDDVFALAACADDLF